MGSHKTFRFAWLKLTVAFLLVPLTDAPMSEALQEELAAWQSLSAEIWNQFPYDEADELTEPT